MKKIPLTQKIFTWLIVFTFTFSMNIPLNIGGRPGNAYAIVLDEEKGSGGNTTQDPNLPPDYKGTYMPSSLKDLRLPEDPKDMNSLKDEDRELPYEPGVVLLSFTDESVLGLVFKHLFENKQEFSSIVEFASDETNLDTFFKDHPVESIERIYRGFDEKIIPKGTISKYQAKEIRDQAKEFFYERFEELQEKYPKRANRAPKGKDGKTLQPPLLYNTYKITFKDKAGSMQFLADELAKNKKHIKWATPNRKMKLQFEPNDHYYHTQGSWDQDYDDLYALKEDKLNMEPAWDIAQGEGIVVAVIDTGVDYNHDDIADNIWVNPDEVPNNGRDDDGNGYIDDIRGWDFSDNDNDPSDYFGHGTHCAGTIAAIGNNEIGVIGVAPEARIMPVKVFPNAYDNVCAQGIEYAVRMGADVLSNSWGSGGRRPSSPILEEAVGYAYALGCVVVFAAGNSNDDVRYYSPVNYYKTIAVAATGPNDERAEFSNWGVLIDVAAPGVQILSLRAEGTDMYENGQHIVDNDYYRANGTSMACPHVAGLSALILSNNPDFTNEEVKQVLRASADDLGGEGFDIYFGHGRINAPQALRIESRCVAHIEGEFNDYYTGDQFEIKGAAYGDNFRNYTLEYHGNSWSEDEWIQIGGVYDSPVGGLWFDNLLGEWEISDLEGLFYLKVIVRDGDSEFIDVAGPITIVRKQQDGWPLGPLEGIDWGYWDVVDCYPTVADIFLDGHKEVLMRSGGNLYALGYDGANSPISRYNWPVTSAVGKPVVGDINGDGEPEIVFRRGESLCAVNSHGDMLDGFPYDLPNPFPDPVPDRRCWLNECSFFFVLLADIDGDELLDSIFLSKKSLWYEEMGVGPRLYYTTIHVVNSEGNLIWRYTFDYDLSYRFECTDLAVGDVDSDGENEIVALLRADEPQNNKTYVFESDGSIKHGWPISFPATYPNFPCNPRGVALADVDGDNDLEIFVTFSNSRRIYAYHHDGSNVDGWPKYAIVPGLPIGGAGMPVTGNMDNDDDLEIAVEVTFRVTCFNLDGGSQVFGLPLNNLRTPDQFPLIADIDEDGAGELFIIDANKIYLYDSDGSMVEGWPIEVANKLYGLTISDLDLDGDMELIAHDGRIIYVWDLDYPYSSAPDQWTMYKHDLQHTAMTQTNHAPLAFAIVTPNVGTSPLRVRFDASPSMDPDGNNRDLTFEWDFGDGHCARGRIVYHVFEYGGEEYDEYALEGYRRNEGILLDGYHEYNVTLTVTDNYHSRASTVLLVGVYANQRPRD